MTDFMRRRGYNFNEDLQPEVINMQREISALDNKAISFEIKAYPDGSWTAKSTNVEGILTGSRRQSEINEMIKDCIFTYYSIPAKFVNDKLLRNSGEPITAEQYIRVTA